MGEPPPPFLWTAIRVRPGGREERGELRTIWIVLVKSRPGGRGISAWFFFVFFLFRMFPLMFSIVSYLFPQTIITNNITTTIPVLGVIYGLWAGLFSL